MRYKTPHDKDIPVVNLPGATPWIEAWEWSKVLEEKFPEQDANEFAQAVHYNEPGPLEHSTIHDFALEEQGVADGAAWCWTVTLDNGQIWYCSAWCDYTGWDCQSGLDWEEVAFF